MTTNLFYTIYLQNDMKNLLNLNKSDPLKEGQVNENIKLHYFMPA